MRIQNQLANRYGRGFLWLAIALTAVTGLLVGTAAGAVVNPAQAPPPGVSASPDGELGASAPVEFARNAAGQTFGEAPNGMAPEDWPDLVHVRASNGRTGYVEKTVLNELTGADVSTPEEAVAWMKKMDAATWDSKTIPVYESDGRSKIGEFEISRSQVENDG